MSRFKFYAVLNKFNSEQTGTLSIIPWPKFRINIARMVLKKKF